MKKIYQSLIVITLLIAAIHPETYAQSGPNSRSESMKARITRIGTRPSRLISVRLKSGAKLKGYPADIEDESFILVQKNSGNNVPIKYDDVAKASRAGMSGSQKAALQVGAVVAVIVVVSIFKPKPKPGLRCLLCN